MQTQVQSTLLELVSTLIAVFGDMRPLLESGA
jgi:hypothetical protein